MSPEGRSYDDHCRGEGRTGECCERDGRVRQPSQLLYPARATVRFLTQMGWHAHGSGYAGMAPQERAERV